MDLSIIIVNWNSAAFLRKCLLSLSSAAPSLTCEVLVVDNASYDGAQEMIRREFPPVQYIQCDKNLGFSGANNLGARRASGQVFCFLNPDTEVVGAALEIMHGVCRNAVNSGAVGCRLLNTDGTLQTSCIQTFPTVINQVLDAECLRRIFPQSKLWGMAPLFDLSLEPQPVEAISGACLMMRREVFDSIGGFCEAYFMYGEDVDLCYRIKQRGRYCYHVPQAEVVHHGSGSSATVGSGFSIVMMRQSVHLFLCLHHGRFRAAMYRATQGLSALVRMLAAVLTMPFRSRRTGYTLNKWIMILGWSLGRNATAPVSKSVS